MSNMIADQHIVYVAAKLPARSETFVYREVLELRRRGIQVDAVSVRSPETNLGSDALTQLANESIEVYSQGFIPLIRDAANWIFRNPVSGMRVFVTGLFDAAFGAGVPINKRPKLFVQMLGGLALATRLRRRCNNVSHVHAHMAHVPTSIAMYAANSMAVPFSFTGHAADLFRDNSLLPAKLRRAKFVSCISNWHREFYKSVEPTLTDDRLPVVRCGVDVDDFSPNDRSPNSTGRILAVGRLVEKKGFDTLIRACRTLRDRDCHFTCTIIGDGAQRQQLQQLIAQEDVAEMVQLVGSRNNTEVRQLMLQSDIFVLPCKQAASGDRDGIPVVLMEAMACGLPVISGDVVTIRELVQSGRTGEMVAPGDVEALAQAIDRLLNSTETRSRLSEEGRRHVIEEFSLQRNVDRLVDSFTNGNPTMTYTTEKELCPETTA
jgi:glycosyltransferase involved in cell wall biosynthesis